MNQEAGTFATKNVPAHRIDRLPVGFVLMPNAKRWSLDAARKHASIADGPLDRFAAFGLSGEQASIGGVQYWETSDGWWLRASDATKTEPNAPPDGLKDHERWIDVNLRRQTLVAFEGITPVFATLVSSGRNEHETPPGNFRVREKHITATMDGDSEIASDGPYSIEDVPYIQYFYGGYALHGAFWHVSFGHVKSHGCIGRPRPLGRARTLQLDRPAAVCWVARNLREQGQSGHASPRPRARSGNVPRIGGPRSPVSGAPVQPGAVSGGEIVGKSPKLGRYRQLALDAVAGLRHTSRSFAS